MEETVRLLEYTLKQGQMLGLDGFPHRSLPGLNKPGCSDIFGVDIATGIGIVQMVGFLRESWRS